MLAMMQKFKNYKPVFPGARQGATDVSVTAVEDIHHKINHARVGYQMAKTWLLPDETCEAVLRHHEYSELQANGAGLSATSLQHIALTLAAESIYVKQEYNAVSAEWALGSEFALEQMGISQADLDEIGLGIIEELATNPR